MKVCMVKSIDGSCCGAPAAFGYPASNNGAMLLCEAHSEAHKDYRMTLDALLDYRVKAASDKIVRKYSKVFRRLAL